MPYSKGELSPKLKITEMENRGYRPRIQDGYRSLADQMIAFNTGHSKLKYGFHHVTGPATARILSYGIHY